MKNHTPEPWIVIERDRIISQSDQLNKGYFIADCFGPDSEKNASRIVACVNACAGVSTAKLESEASNILEWHEQMFQDRADLAERNLDLKSQRDELLASLINIHKDVKSIHESGDVGQCLSDILDKIAKSVQP